MQPNQRQRPRGTGTSSASTVLALASALACASCAVDPANAAGQGGEAPQQAEEIMEQAFPGEAGVVRQGVYDVRGLAETLDFEDLHHAQVYQGDIVLGAENPAELLGEGDGESEAGAAAGITEASAEPPADLLAEPVATEPGTDGVVEDLGQTAEALAARSDRALWPRGRVYYTVDPSLPNKNRVWNAIRHWHARTPIRFVRRTNQPDFVTFTRGRGCSATIGHTGRRQYVWLARNCSTGSTVHEIGHTVGLWHEQSRTDRNQYVTIHWNNIVPAMRHNFQTYAQMGFDGRNVGRYDTGSIMHYGSYAFSRNGRRTITTRGGATIGQRSGLSSRDIAGVRAIY